MRETRLRASLRHGGAGDFNFFYWCQNIQKITLILMIITRDFFVNFYS
jgi:hypothetical protein